MSTAVNITEEEMPILRPIPFTDGQDHRHYRIMEDWHYNKLPGMYFVVKKGKVINGASVPKMFSNIFSPTGILFIGAILHDPGYEDAGLWFIANDGNEMFSKMTRQELDDLFGRICRHHYPEHQWAINKAEALLEIGGGSAWEECREKENNGN